MTKEPSLPLRIVLHAHSTWSYDGTRSLADIARIYARWGIDAVLMTEHDSGFDPGSFDAYRAECAAASEEGALLVPGIEYSSPENDIHILTWGLERFLAEHRPVAETLGRVQEEDGVAIFAHAVRREAWKKFDAAWIPALQGIELWNRKSDGIAWGREALKLVHETGLPATIGHDFHRLRQIYPLWQAAPPPNSGNRADWAPAIIAALRAGQTVPYAFGRPLIDGAGQPGPALHLWLERLRRAQRNFANGRAGRRCG